jgi:hypothetical protein
LIERQQWLYHGRDISGYRVQATILKDKACPGMQQIVFDLTFDDVVQGDSA